MEERLATDREVSDWALRLYLDAWVSAQHGKPISRKVLPRHARHRLGVLRPGAVWRAAEIAGLRVLIEVERDVTGVPRRMVVTTEEASAACGIVVAGGALRVRGPSRLVLRSA